jgi:hypothetical protein
MNIEAYDAIAECGGISKRYKSKQVEDTSKKQKGLKQKARLKSKSKPIPKEVKEAVLKEKGGFCFMGLCEHCGGTAEATDPHHFPHKGPHATPDEVKYLWPANRICHDYYHDHPLEEKELFKKIEAEGWKVYWKVESKC